MYFTEEIIGNQFRIAGAYWSISTKVNYTQVEVEKPAGEPCVTSNWNYE
jgi:hypothetical protein